jgi:hypothetical protein
MNGRIVHRRKKSEHITRSTILQGIDGLISNDTNSTSQIPQILNKVPQDNQNKFNHSQIQLAPRGAHLEPRLYKLYNYRTCVPIA